MRRGEREESTCEAHDVTHKSPKNKLAPVRMEAKLTETRGIVNVFYVGACQAHTRSKGAVEHPWRTRDRGLARDP